MPKDKIKTEKYYEKIIHEFKQYKKDHINYCDQYFEKKYSIIPCNQESKLCSHIKITPIVYDDVHLSIYIPKKNYIIIHVSEPQTVPFVGSILVCKMLQNTVIEKPHRQTYFLMGDNIIYDKKKLMDTVMRFSY